MIEDCECLFDPYHDDPTEESWHFYRQCGKCGRAWYSLHCKHDGVQSPCPSCGNVTKPQ